MKLIGVFLLTLVLGGCVGVHEHEAVRTVEIDSQGFHCAGYTTRYNAVEALIDAMSKASITKIVVYSAMKLPPERENELFKAFRAKFTVTAFWVPTGEPPGHCDLVSGQLK